MTVEIESKDQVLMCHVLYMTVPTREAVAKLKITTLFKVLKLYRGTACPKSNSAVKVSHLFLKLQNYSDQSS